MKIVFVLGGADSVFTDLRAAFALCVPDVIIAVNDVMSFYPGSVDAAVTLHPNFLSSKQWLSRREAKGHRPIKRVFSHKAHRLVTDVHEYKWPEMTYSGSSGHFAAKIALEVYEASHVILCGIPMTATPHIYDNTAWDSVSLFWGQWELTKARLVGKVKSMSGRTAELLGTPDEDWLSCR